MAEGGIHNGDPKFAKELKALCEENQALLILDEVQTGLGRTGNLFSYEWLGIEPDIITLAKALGGGFPLGAMVTKAKIAKVLQPGTHGTTLGGNPLGAAVAKCNLDLINQPEVLANLLKKEKIIRARVDQIQEKFDFMQSHRGKGFLIGLHLKEEYHGKGATFVKAAQEEGLLILVAGPDVNRFTPSLLISEEEISSGLDRFERAVQKVVQS